MLPTRIGTPTRISSAAERYAADIISPASAESRSEYVRDSTAFMQALALRPDLKAVKLGRGDLNKSGDDVLDGIFLRKDGTRLGIADFGPPHTQGVITRGILVVMRELQHGNIAKACVVFYGPKKEAIESAYNDAVSIVDPDLRKKISLTFCPPDAIPEIAASLPVD